ncbi:MAG: DMT family transporter [Limnohabitans sp.]|jgi:drug/metabolite transporter (DMT)-like permease|nr:DMT family transporter [Limnohabitans sp.]
MTPKEQQGMWFGLLGVMTFAVTLPVTRLAVGTPEDPHLSGVFVAMGRAAVAGILSIVYLWFTRALRPTRSQIKGLGLVAVGVVFGFPLFTSLAMRYVEASHASVITGVLPLATAALAAVMNRQRPSLGFWVCAVTGTALVVSFALLRSGQAGLALHLADVLLLCAMAFAAVGYAWGSRMSQSMGAEQVICWALVLSLPVTVPLAWWSQPTTTVPWTAWAGFAYVCLFSMWLGFFAWYRGLAMGGTVRVSQIQLLQPFLGMLVAIPVLGERLDALTVGFGLAVVATVFISRQMAVHRS